MATKLENLDLEVKHFNNFKSNIPNIDSMCQDTIEILLQMGILQISTAYEHALANINGCEVVSEDAADLSNGYEAKLSSVRTSSYGSAYSAPIRGTKNKTGDLLVQVYERKKDKFYYFKIPNKAYGKVPKTSNIEIPFELDGTPRRIPRAYHVIENWWNYEVNSFNELC